MCLGGASLCGVAVQFWDARCEFVQELRAPAAERNCAGVMPICCLNTFEKWLWSKKPVLRPIADSGALVSAISLDARSIRRWRTYASIYEK